MELLSHSLMKKPIPVAFAEEVKEGPAQIYTVLNGQKVETFNIEIAHVSQTRRSRQRKAWLSKSPIRSLLRKQAVSFKA